MSFIEFCSTAHNNDSECCGIINGLITDELWHFTVAINARLFEAYSSPSENDSIKTSEGLHFMSIESKHILESVLTHLLAIKLLFDNYNNSKKFHFSLTELMQINAHLKSFDAPAESKNSTLIEGIHFDLNAFFRGRVERYKSELFTHLGEESLHSEPKLNDNNKMEESFQREVFQEVEHCLENAFRCISIDETSLDRVCTNKDVNQSASVDERFGKSYYRRGSMNEKRRRILTMAESDIGEGDQFRQNEQIDQQQQPHENPVIKTIVKKENKPETGAGDRVEQEVQLRTAKKGQKKKGGKKIRPASTAAAEAIISTKSENNHQGKQQKHESSIGDEICQNEEEKTVKNALAVVNAVEAENSNNDQLLPNEQKNGNTSDEADEIVREEIASLNTSEKEQIKSTAVQKQQHQSVIRKPMKKAAKKTTKTVATIKNEGTGKKN